MAVRAGAHDDRESVLALTRSLVRIPSRSRIDSYEPIVDYLMTWMASHGLPAAVLRDTAGNAVAVTAQISGAAGSHWVLDACLDTAPFGDESAWAHSPTSAVIQNGWMYGRGSSDSKVAIAIFCHLAVRLQAARHRLHGTLSLLFDLDEHTGGFAGAKAFFEGSQGNAVRPDGVMIGYPGLDALVIGGRGVHRLQIDVHGVASHSGGRVGTPNAVDKAADLIRRLRATPIPATGTTHFPPEAKITVTAISGGQGFSITPDLCHLNVDIRTTPTFDDEAATQHIAEIVASVDKDWTATPATRVQLLLHWPAYALDKESPLRATIIASAAGHGIRVRPKIAGPSNIGNYLAELGIPATAGFGVVHAGLHATDERFRIDSVPAVQAIYHESLLMLMSPKLR
ncbi:succinyl-diaminopimelate desuccinylase [Fodinicola feengrottensis]|uniref:Succinyl-diaminopimelate desuccinylase n=2 Tax=Fodinicola feengrottensis TaxID=435914 RepID=A0ABN2H941_9ACTN